MAGGDWASCSPPGCAWGASHPCCLESSGSRGQLLAHKNRPMRAGRGQWSPVLSGDRKSFRPLPAAGTSPGPPAPPALASFCSYPIFTVALQLQWEVLEQSGGQILPIAWNLGALGILLVPVLFCSASLFFVKSRSRGQPLCCWARWNLRQVASLGGRSPGREHTRLVTYLGLLLGPPSHCCLLEQRAWMQTWEVRGLV